MWLTVFLPSTRTLESGLNKLKFGGMPYWSVILYVWALHSIAAEERTVLNTLELDVFREELSSIRSNGQYIHMVEFGGGYETSELSFHDAIISWSVISHDIDIVTSLGDEFNGSKRVTVKHVPPDFSVWEETIKNPWKEEGSLADYESYVSELQYFGAKDKAAFWIFNNGKARVDVAIAALPLLSRTNGIMIVSDWFYDECYAESLLQFYDIVKISDSLAVLRPKPVEHVKSVLAVDPPAHYDWCFSIIKGGKIVKHHAGPSDTGGVFHSFQRDDIGCIDIAKDIFYCTKDKSTCASCYGVMKAVSNRGYKVRQSLKGVAELAGEVGAVKEL